MRYVGPYHRANDKGSSFDMTDPVILTIYQSGDKPLFRREAVSVFLY